MLEKPPEENEAATSGPKLFVPPTDVTLHELGNQYVAQSEDSVRHLQWAS